MSNSQSLPLNKVQPVRSLKRSSAQEHRNNRHVHRAIAPCPRDTWSGPVQCSAQGKQQWYLWLLKDLLPNSDPLCVWPRPKFLILKEQLDMKTKKSRVSRPRSYLPMAGDCAFGQGLDLPFNFHVTMETCSSFPQLVPAFKKGELVLLLLLIIFMTA